MTAFCLACAKNGEDCCSCFYAKFVTLGDVRRMAEFLGKKPADFVKHEELSGNDKETYLYAKRPHGYYYDLAYPDGRLLQLKAKDDGTCIFLRDGGSCGVYPARPLACRIFPFWFSGKGEVIVDNNGLDCPIICSGCRQENLIERRLADIGLTEAEMKSLVLQLRTEIEEYRKGLHEFLRSSSLA